MIKLTINAGRAIIPNKGWDYIKSIVDHIAANKDTTSLTEYAIKFNALANNIELEKAFTPHYCDGAIKIYTNSDWGQRMTRQPYPIMVVEVDKWEY
jgi:hypothetical protein